MALKADVKGELNDLALQLVEDFNEIKNHWGEDVNQMWNYLMHEIESYSE